MIVRTNEIVPGDFIVTSICDDGRVSIMRNAFVVGVMNFNAYTNLEGNSMFVIKSINANGQVDEHVWSSWRKFEVSRVL